MERTVVEITPGLSYGLPVSLLRAVDRWAKAEIMKSLSPAVSTHGTKRTEHLAVGRVQVSGVEQNASESLHCSFFGYLGITTERP